MQPDSTIKAVRIALRPILEIAAKEFRDRFRNLWMLTLAMPG